MIAVPRANIVGFAGLSELLLCVLTHGLKQAVSRSACSVFGNNKRLVDEQTELVEYLEAFYLGGSSDGLRRIQVESTHEHRQPAEQHPFGLGQQCVRPVDR